MLLPLIVLFVTIPLIELFLLIELSQYVGVPQTIALVIITGILGAYLARSQGIKTIRKMATRVRMGESPSREVADGALVLIGGALLLTPGLLTDATGFVLLLPFTRPYVRRRLTNYLSKKARKSHVTITRFP